jgi:hypothetical protein
MRIVARMLKMRLFVKSRRSLCLLLSLCMTLPLLVQCQKKDDNKAPTQTEKPAEDKTPKPAAKPEEKPTVTSSPSTPAAGNGSLSQPPSLNSSSAQNANTNVFPPSEAGKAKETAAAVEAPKPEKPVSVKPASSRKSNNSVANQQIAALQSSQKIDLSKLDTSEFTPEQLAKLHALVKARTTEEMSVTLAKINEMRSQLKELSNLDETDIWVKWLRRVQYVCVGVNTFALTAHSKNPDFNAAVAAISVLSAVANTLLRHYDPINKEWVFYSIKAGGQDDIATIVDESLRKVEPLADSDPEIKRAVQALKDSLVIVKENQSKVTALVDEVGGVQDAAVLLSTYDLLSHFLPKYLKYSAGSGLRSILQTFVPAAATIQNNAKRGASISSGASSLPDVLNLTMGLGTADIQNMILKIEGNLGDASRRLEREIKERSGVQ